jgi:hypothetical protein
MPEFASKGRGNHEKPRPGCTVFWPRLQAHKTHSWLSFSWLWHRQSCKRLPAFRRNVSPRSSGFNQTTRRYNTQEHERNLHCCENLNITGNILYLLNWCAQCVSSRILSEWLDVLLTEWVIRLVSNGFRYISTAQLSQVIKRITATSLFYKLC